MTWEKKRNIFGKETGDWIAKGSQGHFLLWKDGKGGWRILYMDDINMKVKFRCWADDLRHAKKLCQENYYWEAEDGQDESGSKGSP